MRIFNLIGIALLLVSCQAQQGNEPAKPMKEKARAKGNLFIIGGGSRPMSMMENLVSMSMSSEGYGIVFTQSSSEPDTSFFYTAKQLVEFTNRPIIHLDSAKVTTFPIDSVLKADLIYLTGGDQSRFLNNVSPDLRAAIKTAYQNGATIAGSSAGAALMSEVMITGDQNFEPEYESTYRLLKYGNGIYQSGLGLLDSIIIDQHFVARSRYNRLISALADTKYPYAAGIEESTALVVNSKNYSVVGEGQVLIFERPENFTEYQGQIGFRDLKISAYLDGDTFHLEP